MGNEIGFIKFNLTKIIDKNISSASLQFYFVASSSWSCPGYYSYFYLVENNSWDENTITWNNMPNKMLLKKTSCISINFDATEIIKEYIINNKTFITFAFKHESNDINLGSKEYPVTNSQENRRPVLSVNYFTQDKCDQDNDGVIDSEDLCPNTPSNETINSNGCSCSQITIPFRNCSLSGCEGEYFVNYPLSGFDTCNSGVITQEYSCQMISSHYDTTCDSDDDNDGVLDSEDKCSNTIEKQIIYGCSCEQILTFKLGISKGELKNGCSKGIINVFIKQIGWAKNLSN